MGLARIKAAADEVHRLEQTCENYLAAHPQADAPPAPLLRQLACAGRELVVATGEHLAHTEPAIWHGTPQAAV